MTPPPAKSSTKSPAQKAMEKLGLRRDIDLALHLPLRYDLGNEDCTWLREEYTVKSPKGVIDQEGTILAAWIFAEENTFNPETEFEIDDQVWLMDDTDME